jgi:hypothetical protein
VVQRQTSSGKRRPCASVARLTLLVMTLFLPGPLSLVRGNKQVGRIVIHRLRHGGRADQTCPGASPCILDLQCGRMIRASKQSEYEDLWLVGPAETFGLYYRRLAAA